MWTTAIPFHWYSQKEFSCSPFMFKTFSVEMLKRYLWRDSDAQRHSHSLTMNWKISLLKPFKKETFTSSHHKRWYDNINLKKKSFFKGLTYHWSQNHKNCSWNQKVFIEIPQAIFLHHMTCNKSHQNIWSLLSKCIPHSTHFNEYHSDVASDMKMSWFNNFTVAVM